MSMPYTTTKNSQTERPESRTVIRFNPPPAALVPEQPNVEEQPQDEEQHALTTLSEELTAVVRRTISERDQLQQQLTVTQGDRDRLRNQRDEMMQLIIRWQQHAARLERYNAALEREMQSERLENRDARDAQRDANLSSEETLKKSRDEALHLAQRAFDLADDVLQSRWISRKRQRHLQERLQSLRGPEQS